jgi:hypothetical protein
MLVFFGQIRIGSRFSDNNNDKFERMRSHNMALCVNDGTDVCGLPPGQTKFFSESQMVTPYRKPPLN